MIEVTNECVDCGLPCLGDACPYRNVKRYYCDECKEEEKTYHFEGRHLCLDCIAKELLEVEGNEDF
jgi:hypothetical protein